MFEFSTASKSRLEGVDPQLIKLMEESLKVSPIDFGIPQFGGLRTAGEQRFLYQDGKSKCDGYSIKSKHQFGRAVDVYAYVNGRASWDEAHLSMIAGVVLAKAKELGLNVRWGGTFGSDDFDGWDKPHFEMI